MGEYMPNEATKKKTLWALRALWEINKVSRTIFCSASKNKKIAGRV
jgi:hypothetical protein